MNKSSEPDQTLMKMPSLRAVKSFVAAAKYGSFTRAAEALCVTQAAISRQIKELEEFLGTELFVRSGRTVKLSVSGLAFFDSALLSFINISQAAERIRSKSSPKQSLTVCCSYAFSALWMQPRISSFLEEFPGVDLRVIAAQDFLEIETAVRPDVFITKMTGMREGYGSLRLFHDLIYPVCTPKYLSDHPHICNIEGIPEARLLDLNPYGRTQVAEHVDWAIWLAFHGIALPARSTHARSIFSSNDYHSLIQMALAHQGVALGWDHLVGPLLEKGLLIRPVEQEVAHTERCHYLDIRSDMASNDACSGFRDWVLDHCARAPARITRSLASELRFAK